MNNSIFIILYIKLMVVQTITLKMQARDDGLQYCTDTLFTEAEQCNDSLVLSFILLGCVNVCPGSQG